MKTKLTFLLILIWSIGLSQNKLVAHYPFDGNANDESGNLLHGNIVGNPSFESGFSGEAIHFTNPSGYTTVTQYVELPVHSILTGLENKSFTISFYVNSTDNLRQNGRLIGTSESNNRFQFNYNKQVSNVITASFMDGSENIYLPQNNGYDETPEAVITDGEWHRIDCILDRENLTASLYVDGAFVNSKTFSSLDKLPFDRITIGANLSQPTYGARNTSIDELKIYNYALTENEISELYGNTTDKKLVAHYPFDGNANDESGNEIHGQIYGSPTFVSTIDDLGLNFENPSGYRTISQWVQLPNNQSLLNLENSSFTISIRYKSTDSAQQNGRLCGSQSSSKSIVLNYNSQTIKNAYTSINDGTNNLIIGKNENQLITTDNIWHTQVIVLDRENKTFTEYINGIKIAEKPYTKLDKLSFTDFTIGAIKPNDTFGARHTTVDDLKIYNYALSKEEIINLNESPTASNTINKKSIIVFPNPASSLLKISEIEQNSMLSLFTYSGQIIIRINNANSIESINVSHIPSGIYFLKIEGNSIHTSKVIICH